MYSLLQCRSVAGGPHPLPGRHQHYFADSSLPSYDAEATALLTRRVLAFLGRI
ncbi:hypothetical protein [Mycobacterium sp. KBS0706]|uniref:hypothetical protein n=1 Tax=Mycobacterium sp. KBS0706 TaxID=2578109 RepID=UPI00163D4F63|nr:hypothetical protein [Mycobacterium sp. KBS0706]